MFFIKFFILLITGIYIIYKDLKERIIPNKIIIFLIISGIIITIYEYNNFISHVLGSLIIGMLLFFIAVITKSFGMGDVKYMFAIGLILGLSTSLYALLFAFLIGGFVSSVLLITKKVNKKDYIAFGPYLVIGSILALIFF